MRFKSRTGAPPRGEGARAAAFLVSAGILLSRITGLVRERVFASYFGSSLYADVWRAALKIPNLLQNLLGEGTLSASLIPVYSQLLEEGEEGEAGEGAARFAGATLGILAAVAGILVLLGVLLAPLLVKVVYSGWDAERQALTTSLVRILFPMVGLLVMSAWALAILNSHRRFFVSYVAPAFWNLAIIGTLVGAGVYFHAGESESERLLLALGWGALVGGGLQLGVQIPFLLRHRRGIRISLDRKTGGVREAIRSFLPVVTARGVVNVGAWIDGALASFLATGAMAVLGYAQTLYILPISLFGMAIAASELPELSRRREGGTRRIADRVSRALERIGFLSIPSMLAYLFLGDVIVAGLLQTGQFQETQVLATYIVLAAYSSGLPASSASRVLSSAYYALRDTRTPARIAYLRVVVSLSVGAALMFPMDRYAVGTVRLGAVGLAIGASLGAWIEYVLLRRGLREAVGRHGPRTGVILRVGLSGAIATASGVGVSLLLPSMHPIWAALAVLAPFGAIYLSCSRIMGLRPLQGRSAPTDGAE